MSKSTFWRLVPLATLVLSSLVAPATAQPGFQPGERLEGFKPIDDYQLVLDGEAVDSAQIYSNPTPAILVVAPKL